MKMRPNLVLSSPPLGPTPGDSFQEARSTLVSPPRVSARGSASPARPARMPLSATHDARAYDTSGDGLVDALDTNSDGRIDTVLKRLDGAPLSAAGYVPVKVDFAQGIGRPRAPSEVVVGYDTSGDGLVDALDTTGDGKIDMLLMRKRAVLSIGFEDGEASADFRHRSTWLHVVAKRFLFSAQGVALKLALLACLFGLVLWGSWRVTPWHDDAPAAWGETLRVLLIADATIWVDTGLRAWYFRAFFGAARHRLDAAVALASAGAWLVLKDCATDVDPMCQRMRSFALAVLLVRAARVWPRLLAGASGAARAFGWDGTWGGERHADAVDFDLHGADSDEDEEGDEEDELGSQERSGLMPANKVGPAPLPGGYGTGGAPNLMVEWHHPLYAKFQVQNTGPQSTGPPPLEL